MSGFSSAPSTGNIGGGGGGACTSGPVSTMAPVQDLAELLALGAPREGDTVQLLDKLPNIVKYTFNAAAPSGDAPVDGTTGYWNVSHMTSEGLRKEPVSNEADLKALISKDYELRKVVSTDEEYVFHFGQALNAGSSDIAGIGGTWVKVVAEDTLRLAPVLDEAAMIAMIDVKDFSITYDDTEKKEYTYHTKVDTSGTTLTMPSDGIATTDGKGWWVPNTDTCLRGKPVATIAELTALDAKNFELRQVAGVVHGPGDVRDTNYVFDNGAITGDYQDDGMTGWWIEEKTPQGLRGNPVANATELTAIEAKDFELRQVLADPLTVGSEDAEYVFKLGATTGTIADDLGTGFWTEQIVQKNIRLDPVKNIAELEALEDVADFSITYEADATNLEYRYYTKVDPNGIILIQPLEAIPTLDGLGWWMPIEVTKPQLRLQPVADQVELELIEPLDFMIVKKIDDDTVWTFRETTAVPPADAIPGLGGTGYWYTIDKARVVDPIYTFNTAVGGTNNQGDVVLDNADASLATTLFINRLAKNGSDYSKKLLALRLGDTMSLVDDLTRVDKYTFNVIGSPVLNGDVYEIPVALDPVKSSPDGTILDLADVEINLGDIFVPEVALRLPPVLSFAEMTAIKAADYMICLVDGLDNGEFIFRQTSDPVPLTAHVDDLGTGYWESTESKPILRHSPIVDATFLPNIRAKDFMIVKLLSDESVWTFKEDTNQNIPTGAVADALNTGYWVLNKTDIPLRLIPVPDEVELANVEAKDFMTTRLLVDGSVWVFKISPTLPIPVGTVADNAATGYWETVIDKTALRVTPVADEAELKAINAVHFMITKREDTGFEYIFEQTGSSFNSSFSSSFGGATTPPVGIPDDAGTGFWFLYDAHKIYRIPIIPATATHDVDTLHPEPLNENTMVWVNEVLQQPLLTYTLSGSVVSFIGKLEDGDVVIVAANPK